METVELSERAACGLGAGFGRGDCVRTARQPVLAAATKCSAGASKTEHARGGFRETGLSFVRQARRLIAAGAITLVMSLTMALATTFAAFAQAPSSAPPASKAAPAANATAMPTADQILDRYVKAIGGREAWKKLTSRVSTGTIEVPKMRSAAPGHFTRRRPTVSCADHNQWRYIPPGLRWDHGWTDDPQNGLRSKPALSWKTRARRGFSSPARFAQAVRKVHRDRHGKNRRT